MKKISTNKMLSKKLLLMLVGLCLVQMGAIYDNALMSIAMSNIIASTHSSVAQVQMLTALYPLLAGALMIVGGFCGGIIGWSRLLMIGLIVIAIAEALVSIANNVAILTVGRTMTGIGASALIPAVLGLVAEIFNQNQRAVAFSAIAASTALMSALGPLLGGLVIESLSWRYAFALLSVYFLVLLFFIKVFPQTTVSNKVKFDSLGAVLISLTLLLIMFAMTMMGSWGVFFAKSSMAIYRLSPCPIIFIISLIVGYLALKYEASRESKGLAVILPTSIICNAETRAGLYITSLAFLINGGLSFLTVTFLQIIMGYSVIKTALFLSVLAIGMVISSVLNPWLLSRYSDKKICRLAILLASFGCLAIALGVEQEQISSMLAFGLFCCGFGAGILTAMSSTIVTNSTSQELAELSGGIQGSMRNIGQTLGIAIAGAVMIWALTFSTIKGIYHYGPNLAQQHKVDVIKNIPIINNMELSKTLEGSKLDSKVQQTLLAINFHSQFIAIRLAYIALSLLILLFLIGTTALKTDISQKHVDPNLR